MDFSGKIEIEITLNAYDRRQSFRMTVFSFMTYLQISNMCNTTGATGRAETIYSSEHSSSHSLLVGSVLLNL